MHAVYCKSALYFDLITMILTVSRDFILKFGGDLSGKFRRRLGTETTYLIGAAKSTKPT